MPKWTTKEKQVLDLLLEGCEWADVEKRLNISRVAVKRRLYRMYRRAGIKRNRFGVIALIAEETYRRRPDLIPFANGDRAREAGAVSARDFATVKLAISAYREKRHEPNAQESSDHLSKTRSKRATDECDSGRVAADRL